MRQLHWTSKPVTAGELRAQPFDLVEVQLVLPRWYSFREWPSLVQWVDAVNQADSPVAQFESAAKALIHGGRLSLEHILAADSAVSVRHPDPLG